MNAPQTVTRRRFLSIVGLGAAAAATWRLGSSRDAQLVRVSDARVLMGTVVNITVIDTDVAAARSAVATTLDRMAALEFELTRHRSTSPLSQLNRDGYLSGPPQSLVDVLELASEVSLRTDGAFDATIKPLSDLYDASDGVPSDAAVDGALPLVDWQGVSASRDMIRLAQPGMAVTLDGIAKGYVVDAAVAEMRSRGYADVLVEAGGDLLASGTNGTTPGWNVAIQSPRDDFASVAKVSVTNRALATSGDYHNSYTPDFARHHIIDPRTGYSSPELASATVVAPSAVEADAFATAMMVAGPDAGLAIAESVPDTEVLLVTKDLARVTSTQFPDQ